MGEGAAVALRPDGPMVTETALIDDTAPPKAQPGAWKRALIEFAALAVLIIVAFDGAAETMASQWLTSSSYHHGLVVAPIAVWLIVRRGDWNLVDPQRDLRGAILFLLAAAIFLFGRASSLSIVTHAAFVLALVGAVVTIFGGALARRWSFALAFLIFMIPAGAEAAPLLQQWTSFVAALLLNAAGVETLRDGFMLTTAAGRFEVAESCAGLRFLTASAMIASLLISLAFRRGASKAAFLAAAVGAAFLANWLRVFLVVAIATLSERRIGVGLDHVAFGWAIFVALMAGLILFARRYAFAAALRAPTPRGSSASAWALPAAIATLAFTVAYDAIVISRAATIAAPPAPTPIASGFDAVGADEWHVHAPFADALMSMRQRGPVGEVIVSHAFFVAERDGAEIAGADVRAADGEKWRRIAIRREAFNVAGAQKTVTVETIEDAAGEKLDVTHIYWIGARFHSNASAFKFDAGLHRLAGSATAGGAVFIAAKASADGALSPAIAAYLKALKPVADWRPGLEN